MYDPNKGQGQAQTHGAGQAQLANRMTGSSQRDIAFSNIFGSAPPRSGRMNSSGSNGSVGSVGSGDGDRGDLGRVNSGGSSNSGSNSHGPSSPVAVSMGSPVHSPVNHNSGYGIGMAITTTQVQGGPGQGQAFQGQAYQGQGHQGQGHQGQGLGQGQAYQGQGHQGQVHQGQSHIQAPHPHPGPHPGPPQLPPHPGPPQLPPHPGPPQLPPHPHPPHLPHSKRSQSPYSNPPNPPPHYPPLNTMIPPPLRPKQRMSSPGPNSPNPSPIPSTPSPTRSQFAESQSPRNQPYSSPNRNFPDDRKRQQQQPLDYGSYPNGVNNINYNNGNNNIGDRNNFQYTQANNNFNMKGGQGGVGLGPSPYGNGSPQLPPQQQSQQPQQRLPVGLGVHAPPKGIRSMSSPIHPGSPFMRQGQGNGPPNQAAMNQQQPALPNIITGPSSSNPTDSQRSMSMTTSSFPSRNNFYNNNVTLSGRVIPQRNNDIIINMNGNANHQLSHSKGSNSSLLSSFKSAGGKPSELNGANGSGSKPQRTTSTSSSVDDHGVSSHSTIVTTSRKVPLVYPAMLSKVAEVFRQRIVLGDRVKNELTYKNSFTGSEAVDLITYIIKTPDRNLALLLGRALDAQKFFHDVTYDHRLRDTHNEVYQFNEIVIEEEQEQQQPPQTTHLIHKNSSSSTHSNTNSQRSLSQKSDTNANEPSTTTVVSVNGVFTLLAECYSPTCTRDRLCYSIACPRRLEQQARLNMKPQPGLKRAESRLSLHGDDEVEQKLWIHTVSKEIADSVDDKEKKRQEVICEVIYTERDFVKDLEYLRDFWIKPLRSSNIIPEARRERFIRAVLSFAMDVHFVNTKLAEALTKRQQLAPVVRQIGDIFLEHVTKFEPFIRYGANQLYGKYEFEREKSMNPAFVKFVDETERMKESRKLELNGYLTKPTTRLARYPLLLEAVLKHTSDDNPDKENIPQAIKIIREFLTRLNIETGKTENRFSLMQLSQALVYRPGEYVDLKLTDDKRQIIFKGALKKRTGDKDNQGDVQVYLFDNSLLFVKVKVINKREQHKVHRKPIPLELLILAEGEEILLPRYAPKRTSSSLIPTTKTPSKAESQNRFPITFQHLGRRGYELTLYATNFISRKKWIENIDNQKEILSKAGDVYKRHALQCKFSSPSVRINCMAPSDGGRKLLFGTDNGIFVSDVRITPNGPTATDPIKLITIPNVTQLDVLDEYSTLLALSDKSLYSWGLEALDPSDPGGNYRRGKKVMGHINFYRVGICLGRMLVCTVKSSSMTSTVRVLEPFDPQPRNKRQTAAPLRRFLQSQSEGLKVFKEFYIASETLSISFLKRKLCVGCAKGFEIVDLSTLETQSLLDPADTSLDFAIRRESLKPSSIYRLHSDFLLNYSDFSFFVNGNGWRSRPDWLIHWEGLPQHFALSYPYLIAFEPNFIEIRHMDTAEIVKVITGENIRFLHESTREILYVQEDERGFDEVVSLDFWAKSSVTSTTTTSLTEATPSPSITPTTSSSTTTTGAISATPPVLPPLSTSTSTTTLVEHADEGPLV